MRLRQDGLPGDGLVRNRIIRMAKDAVERGDRLRYLLSRNYGERSL